MCNNDEVKRFLEELSAKFILLPDPVSFENREKNIQALITLKL